MGQVALGQVQITGIDTVAAGLGTIPAGAKWARVTCEVADVRWRDDGVAPTATVGQILRAIDGVFPLPEGACVYEVFTKLSGIKFIGITPGAILDVAFYK